MGNRIITASLKGKAYNSGDEYYTRKEDIEDFLPYWDLSDKVVYCPCDSEKSEFVKYFKQKGKCKELIYTSDDFRTHEDLFQKADIIITNPPFSLKIDFLNMIRKYKKDYIIILHCISTQLYSIEELNNKVYIYGQIEWFNTPNNELKRVYCKWFSNMYNPEKIILTKHKMTFSGKYKTEYDKNGDMYKFYSWIDINLSEKEIFLTPITYDSGYKFHIPNLEIIGHRRHMYKDRELKNLTFQRFLCKLNI